jgi:OOP family OmpA-OmpF porin
MRKAFCSLIVVGILFAAVSGFAEMRAGAYSISPYIGMYKFEGNLDLDSGPTYGVRLGYDFTKHFGLEADLGYVDTKYTEFAPDRYTDVYNYRLEALYHFFPDKKLVPFVAAGIGGQSMNYKNTSKSNSTHFAGDYGVGLKYFLTENVALRTDLRHILGFASIENNLAWTFGLTFLFGGSKPVAEKAIVREAAAPVEVDTDGDGVKDSRDKCPGTPSGVKVDLDGCPLDMDGDGVYDYLDKCPDTPKGAKVDKDGCPLDTDGDGVPDYLDKCPDTPKGVKVDSNGCPPMVEKRVEPKAATAVEKQIVEKGRVTLNVQFDTNKAVVKPVYEKDIKELADVMTKYPELKIMIEGHTDNVGAQKYNMNLSQKRAEAVKNVLVKKYRIDPSRLTAKGFGPTKPIADNKTKAGRQENRRVEASAEYIVKK